MKFSAFISEYWDGEVKWYWSVHPVGYPEDVVDGVADCIADAKKEIFSNATAYRVGLEPLSEEWVFEL